MIHFLLLAFALWITFGVFNWIWRCLVAIRVGLHLRSLQPESERVPWDEIPGVRAIKFIFKVAAAICLILVAAGVVALILNWPVDKGPVQYPSQYSALSPEDQKFLAESEKPGWSPSPSPTIESVPVKRAVLVNPYPTRDITDQILPRLKPERDAGAHGTNKP
jgi:hypothetical protein